MPLTERRAEHGHHVVDARLPRRQAVGVALDDHGPPRRGHCLAGGVDTVEHRALGKQRGLGGVDVFRGVGGGPGQHPAAERHAPAERIADRKDHAVAKAVVVSGLILTLDGQAHFGQVAGGNARGRSLPQEPVPGGGREAQFESRDRVGSQAAAGEVVAGRPSLGAPLEAGGESFRRPCQRLEERRLVVGGEAAATARDRDARPVGELLERFAKLELLHLHDEGERVAADVAHPAAKRLAFRVHLEAGPRVLVPGAEARHGLATAPQGNVRPDQIDDIGRVAHPLFEVVVERRTSGGR